MKTILLLIAALSTILLSSPDQYTILISFDGFRWDYPNRGLTPNIARMSEEGVSATSLEPVFPSKTFPNHLSIVTGMYPENHGILMNTFSNPNTGETYRLGDSVSVRDPKWYLAEAIWETAERNGVRTASYFWPGTELNGPRRPYYRELYDHSRPYGMRIEGVLKWLQLPEQERPHFLTLYFHETDSRGHRYGPTSPEVNVGIAMMDSLLGVLLDGLARIRLLEKTNIIITSDHGMTEVSLDRLIDVSQRVPAAVFTATGDGPVMMIAPKEGKLTEVYQQLKSSEDHYRAYLREEMPARFHFSQHPFISPIILVADMGWSLVTPKIEERYRRRPGAGNHGFDNHHLDMHGVFYAMGPAFKSGYKTGTVRNIDIYPLLCEIMGIVPRANIDGSLERISFLLKDE